MNKDAIITRVDTRKIDENCGKVFDEVSASIAALIEVVISCDGEKIDKDGNVAQPIMDAYKSVAVNLKDKLYNLVQDTAMTTYTDGYLEAHDQLTRSICKLLSRTDLDHAIIEAIKKVNKDLQENYKPASFTVLTD